MQAACLGSNLNSSCVALGKLFKLSYLIFFIFEMRLKTVPTSWGCWENCTCSCIRCLGQCRKHSLIHKCLFGFIMSVVVVMIRMVLAAPLKLPGLLRSLMIGLSPGASRPLMCSSSWFSPCGVSSFALVISRPSVAERWSKTLDPQNFLTL